MVGDDSGLFWSGCPCDPFISSIDPNMTQIAHSSRLPSSAHLEIQPKYWLGSALVTIGLRCRSTSAITCVINAPLSSAEVFTLLLIDYEVWVCDSNPRDINGPAWCTQLYPLWTDGFFACSEPRADRGDGAVPSCSISRRYIALRGTTANGHIPYLPASRQQNRRKLLPTLGFEHRRADIGERDKEFDTEDLESLPHDLQGFQLAPHFAIRFARAIPGLDQINRTPVMRQHDATR